MEYLRDREAITRLANRAVQPRSNWYEIKAKAEDTAEIFVYSEIGFFGASSEEFIGELKEITAPNIDVRINSLGGSVFEAVAIYNALREHPSFVTTKVDAMAASAASVIAMAGDKREMLESSEMMIHEAHGVALGATASDMRELADLLDRQNDKIAAIYARAAGDGRKSSHFAKLMSAGDANMGTFFTPEEAVAEGLADEVVKPAPKTRTPPPAPDPEPEASAIDFSALFNTDPLEYEWA